MLKILTQKYRSLLAAIVTFTLLSPFVTNTLIGRSCFTVLFLFIIMFVTYEVKKQSITKWLLPALGVTSITLVFFYPTKFYPSIIGKLLLELFYIYAIFIFSIDIYSGKKISTDKIFGSVCVYLLIGLAFATEYLIIYQFEPSAFIFTYKSIPIKDTMDFYYFSFITLTTVGFGDIIPNSSVARSFVMLESLTGLFYLAIMVSHLTTLINQSRRC